MLDRLFVGRFNQQEQDEYMMKKLKGLDSMEAGELLEQGLWAVPARKFRRTKTASAQQKKLVTYVSAEPP